MSLEVRLSLESSHVCSYHISPMVISPLLNNKSANKKHELYDIWIYRLSCDVCGNSVMFRALG